MLEIKNLTDTNILTITKCYNICFSNSIHGSNLTTYMIEERFLQSHVDLSMSFGAFLDGELIGFAFVATQGKFAFLLSIGVVPDHRQENIGTHLLKKVLILLKEKNYSFLRVEVDSLDFVVEKLFAKFNFEISRNLFVYKYIDSTPIPSNNVVVHSKDLCELNFSDIPTNLSFISNWENSLHGLYKNGQKYKIVYIEDRNKHIKSYIIVDKTNGRVVLMEILPGLFYKRKLKGLLEYVNSFHSSFLIDRIDEEDKLTIDVLESLKFKKLQCIYELELAIEDAYL